MTDHGAKPMGGFGLLDLTIAIIAASLMATLAVPAFNDAMDRARVSRAIGDIGSLDVAIESFRLKNNDRLPNTLAELAFDLSLDPWQQPYRYLRVADSGDGVGGLRKDGNLNPLNTDYDLYSMGKDGASKGPLSAKASRDDIVRANNGAFIGLGKDF